MEYNWNTNDILVIAGIKYMVCTDDLLEMHGNTTSKYLQEINEDDDD
jgi:hypothetical protein